MQDASAQEEFGKQQQAILDMQARNAKAVAERNAQIQLDQANYEAARLREQGGQETAKSQREAEILRRQKKLAQSTAIARGAANSGDTLDPTSLDIYSGLEGEGEYNALSALYEGKSAGAFYNTSANLKEYEGKTTSDMTLYGGQTEAQLLRAQGATAAYEGSLRANSARRNAAGSIFSGGSSLLDKYAPKKNTIYWNQGGTSTNTSRYG